MAPKQAAVFLFLIAICKGTAFLSASSFFDVQSSLTRQKHTRRFDHVKNLHSTFPSMPKAPRLAFLPVQTHCMAIHTSEGLQETSPALFVPRCEYFYVCLEARLWNNPFSGSLRIISWIAESSVLHFVAARFSSSFAALYYSSMSAYNLISCVASRAFPLHVFFCPIPVLLLTPCALVSR